MAELTDAELNALLMAEEYLPPTDTDVVVNNMRVQDSGKGVSDRSAAADAAQAAASISNDPFEALDLSDPKVREQIAREQENDIELEVDHEKVRAAQKEEDLILEKDIEDHLQALDAEIEELKFQSEGYPVGVTEQERGEYTERASSLKQKIDNKRNEYAKWNDMLKTLRKKMSLPSSGDPGKQEKDVPIVESGPVYPDRDELSTKAKQRQYETGERTYSRTFKDDFVGNMSEHAFNLPVKRKRSIKTASGEDAVFTDSRALQEERRDFARIPMVTTPEFIREPASFYPSVIETILGGALSQITGGGPMAKKVRRGGIMSTPTAPEGKFNLPKLNEQIELRESIIKDNDAQIQSLQEEMQNRKYGSDISDLTMKISLLEENTEQKTAELSQMNRILRRYSPAGADRG